MSGWEALLDNSRRGNDHVNWKFNNARGGGHGGGFAKTVSCWVGGNTCLLWNKNTLDEEGGGDGDEER